MTFSAEGTRDPDDLILAYEWDFGQGAASLTTPNQTVSSVYTTDGAYTATLTVRDVRGATADPVHLPIAVFSGELPRIEQTNLTEAGRTLYHGGDQFRFEAIRSAGVTGLDATTPYLWTVHQHHNDHTHIVLADEAATAITLTLPIEGHAQESDIWYEAELTMIGDKGQRLSFSSELRPELSEVSVDGWPGRPQGPIRLDGVALSYEQSMTVIVGQSYSLVAPPTLLHDGQVGEFA